MNGGKQEPCRACGFTTESLAQTFKPCGDIRRIPQVGEGSHRAEANLPNDRGATMNTDPERDPLRDFGLQYSTDGTSFTTLLSYSVLENAVVASPAPRPSPT